jgi:LacI family transcriptional regulator, kdg operon repressor
MEQITNNKQTGRTTITDVARTAGVSKTTVSRYLSGQYQALSSKTRKRIEDAIALLNYRPNQMAQGLKRDRSYLIGMVIADITNPFSTAILRGAEDLCKKQGYSLMVCNTDNDPAKEREYIFMLQAHRIDGLIINTTGHNNQFLHDLASERTSVVLVDRKVPELGFDTIGIDNEQATKEAVMYLAGQGYKEMALFTEPIQDISSRSERASAFTVTLEQCGYSSKNKIFEVNLQHEGELQKKLVSYISSTARPSRVIFAGNGVILLKIIRSIQQMGLSIPEDVAVAGFDEMDWAPLLGSGITTVAQPTYDIGVTAMERILKRLNGDASPSQNIAFNAQLIRRGSTPKVQN